MDDRRIPGERVFCHGCQNDWPRSEGGLTCPRCQSEFTEILSRPGSPALSLPSLPSLESLDDRNGRLVSPTGHREFFGHNPWDDAPDPDEGDITRIEYNSGPRGTTYSSVTYSSTGGFGGGRRGTSQPGRSDRQRQELEQNFQSMLGNIMGVHPGMQQQAQGLQHYPPNSGGNPFGMFGFPPIPQQNMNRPAQDRRQGSSGNTSTFNVQGRAYINGQETDLNGWEIPLYFLKRH